MKKILLIGIAAFLIMGCASQRPADVGPFPNNYQQLVQEAFLYVAKDPESLQFRFPAPPKPGKMGQDAGDAVYGPYRGVDWGWKGEVMVNGKNSYGGYTGWRLYFYLIRDNEVKRIFTY